MHKASKLYWPVMVTPKNAVAKATEVSARSQKLMLELGLIKAANNGTFSVLPIAQRALDKCIDLVTRRMQAIGGQKVTMPILTSTSLWQKTGRLDGDIDEFFIVRDRHSKEFLLSPTHEEAVTAMLATTAPISYRQLPLRLYQIGPKFRDELKPRSGLMRAKEFLMKDMYTFDRTLSEAQATYEQLNMAYTQLFTQLQVPFVRVAAHAGIMGGSVSHEFHYLSQTGEDRIMQCSNCGRTCNMEALEKQLTCTQCGHCTNVKEMRGIEVGHAFLLGDKYSRPLKCTFLQSNGKPESLIMGCYGIGVSRLVAASLEVLSTETHLRWPTLLAPFDVCILGPKEGSKEQTAGDAIEMELCQNTAQICESTNLLHDDRKYLTIGKRLMDMQKLGCPIIVVVGAKSTQAIPRVEVHIAQPEYVVREVELSMALSLIADYIERKRLLLDGDHTVVNVNNRTDLRASSPMA